MLATCMQMKWLASRMYSSWLTWRKSLLLQRISKYGQRAARLSSSALGPHNGKHLSIM